MRHVYTVIVDNGRDDTEGSYTAVMPKDFGDPMDTPLKATGDTPIEALGAFSKVLAEWRHGGADRWIAKPQGQQFVDHFTMGEPLPGPPEKAKA